MVPVVEPGLRGGVLGASSTPNALPSERAAFAHSPLSPLQPMIQSMTRTLTSRILPILLIAGLLGSAAFTTSATAQHKHGEGANHETHPETEMQHRESQHKKKHAEHSSSQPHHEETSKSESPLRHATMQALVLPALADTLGLSADQTRRLEELRDSLLAKQKARREKLHDQKKKVHRLFQESDMPDLEAVRPEIKFLSATREQLKLAPYMTATDMRELLTEEQRDRLSELSRQARHHAVMANMTMQEHMRVKQALRGKQHGGNHHASGNRTSHMKNCPMRHDGSENGENHGRHHGHAGK